MVYSRNLAGTCKTALLLTIAGGATFCGRSPADSEPAGFGGFGTQRDGIAQLLVFNNCRYPVSIGKSQGYGGWDMPTVGTVPAGGLFVHDIGSDAERHESLAFRFFPEGKDPGPGNSSLVEFGLNSDFMHLDWPNLSAVNAYSKPGLRLEADHFVTKTCDSSEILRDCPEHRKIHIGQDLVSCTKGDVWKEPGVRDQQHHPVAVLIKTHCGENTYSYSRDDQDDFPGSVMQSADTEDIRVTTCPVNPD